MPPIADLKLILSDDDARNPGQLNHEIRRLRSELLRLDVQAVTAPTVPSPDGARTTPHSLAVRGKRDHKVRVIR